MFGEFMTGEIFFFFGCGHTVSNLPDADILGRKSNKRMKAERLTQSGTSRGDLTASPDGIVFLSAEDLTGSPIRHSLFPGNDVSLFSFLKVNKIHVVTYSIILLLIKWSAARYGHIFGGHGRLI